MLLAGANGSISPSGTVPVAPGANQTFTITPAATYHVADVLVDGGSVGAVTSHTFTAVAANHTIAASFAIDTYTITVTQTANGTISPGTTVVNHGATQGFTITPAPNYHVVDVVVDGGSVGPLTSYSFANVTANHTITATYAIDTYTISVTQTANGTISPGTTVVNHGATQAFTITPASNYHVVDVVVDGGSVGPLTGYTFTNVTANHTITATYAIDTYTISVTQTANGTISPGTTVVNHGASQSFTITPSPNYHIVDVVVDGGSVGAVTSYNFTNVIANHTLTATYAIDTYTITPTAGANGSDQSEYASDGNYGTRHSSR